MKCKAILSLLLLCVFNFAVASSASQELVSLLQGYKTYQANFTQTTAGADGRTQTSTGRVMIVKPGKFRWEADKPLKQIIIVNDKTLWIYDVALAQATQRTLSDAQGLNPVYLLSGDTKIIANDFKVSKNIIRNKTWYSLIPNNEDYPFKSIKMYFANRRLTQPQTDQRHQ